MMFVHYPPELAQLLTQERIDEARRAVRGFCCPEDRDELAKPHGRVRSKAEPTACSC